MLSIYRAERCLAPDASQDLAQYPVLHYGGQQDHGSNNNYCVSEHYSRHYMPLSSLILINSQININLFTDGETGSNLNHNSLPLPQALYSPLNFRLPL